MMTKHKLPDGSGTYARVVHCATTVDRLPKVSLQSAEQELDEKIKSLMRATKRSYSEAMSVVLNLDGELKARWVRETLRPVRK